MVMVIALTYSCEKQEIGGVYCNCGVITNDGIDGDCYWLDIRNDCSNNIKRFCFSPSDWMTAYVGTDFCVTNESGW